jgi:lysophospholipase L1-like esterase
MTQIAFVGDSITDAASTSLFATAARGYFPWAQAFNRQKWDIVPKTSANRLQFATSGASTATIITNQMSAALASGADTIVWHTGQNDRATGSLTALQAANNMRAVWETIKAAKIRPIATTLCGVTTPTIQQTWNVEFNSYIRTYAAIDGITLCDWASILSPNGIDDGILDPQYAIDSIHPNSLGASRMGRVLAATLNPYVVQSRDPFNGLLNASPNPSMTGGPPPTSWSFSIGASNSVGTQTYEAASDPSKWWRIPHTQGAGNLSQIITFADTISNYNGVRFASLIEVQVLSGSLQSIRTNQYLQGGGTQAICLNQVDGGTLGPQITSSDGTVVLRTPFTTGNATTSLAYCDVFFSGTADFRIRRLATWY